MTDIFHEDCHILSAPICATIDKVLNTLQQVSATMHIDYRFQGKTLTFILNDLAPQYHQAAQDSGYILTDEGFVREMTVLSDALRPCFLNHILYNCQTSLEAVLAQKAKLKPVLWDQALLTFLTHVEDQPIDWYLVGSAALAVRGVEVHPCDIDICTEEADALRLQDLLVDYLIQPVQESEGGVGRWFGRAFMGAKVEWLGGVTDAADADGISDFGPMAQTCLETVYWCGYPVRVPPLELQLEVSIRRGLYDRADKIRRLIDHPVLA